MPSWCAQDILPANIGKTLEDGRKIVPKSVVDLYAFFHPSGNMTDSWIAAEKWFKSQGYEIVSDEEFNKLKFGVSEIPGNCLG